VLGIGEASFLVFCGGVHGVGKSVLCRTLAGQMNAVHLSAGALLRAAGLAKRSQYAVPDVRNNQASIQTALREFRAEHHDRSIVLDGHFCLLTPQNRIEALPCSLFESLSPVAFLLVVDLPSAIASRIADRDGTLFEADLVDRFQRREVVRAKCISRHLAVPLRIVTPAESVVDLARWIADVR